MACADRYPPGPFIASGDKACFLSACAILWRVIEVTGGTDNECSDL